MEEGSWLIVFGDGRRGFFVALGLGGNDVEALHAVAQGVAAEFELLGGAGEVEVVLFPQGSVDIDTTDDYQKLLKATSAQ